MQPRVDPYSALTTRWTLGITVALLPHQDHNMMPILQVKAGRDREVQELPPAPTSVIQPAPLPSPEARAPNRRICTSLGKGSMTCVSLRAPTANLESRGTLRCSPHAGRPRSKISPATSSSMRGAENLGAAATHELFTHEEAPAQLWRHRCCRQNQLHFYTKIKNKNGRGKAKKKKTFPFNHVNSKMVFF